MGKYKKYLLRGLRRSLRMGLKFAFAFALAQFVVGEYRTSYYIPGDGPSLAMQIVQKLAAGFVAGFLVSFLVDLASGKLKNEE